MSSGAIMAMIRQKETELKQVKQTKTSVDKIYEAMDCVTSKYVQAGELMKTAGDIGGVPFDGGKTEKSGAELKKITTETGEVIGDLEKRIADLEAQIATLYAQYQAALAREAEEARAAAKRNVRVRMAK